MSSMVLIEHRDGRQYAVTLADYRKHYEAEGFKALRYEDGSPLPDDDKKTTKADRG